ncbi:MAG: hypothetical protein WA736_14350 [Candidatus Acidiferrum sp.]
MLEPLRRLRKEIDAISTAMRAARARVPPDDPLIDRIQELVYTWSTNVQPGLTTIGVPTEVVNRADAAFLSLARGTARAATRAQLLNGLSRARRTLIEQILLEVAKLPRALQIGGVTSAQKVLIPEIPDLPNELIPNALQGWIPQIREFLRRNNFDRNVFIMISYKDSLSPLIGKISRKLIELKLNPILARDHPITDDLYNPIACLLCCNYGIAVFDRPEVQQVHNPNVVYELGMIQLLKRPCVILKHNKLKRMPTDILSRLYENYLTSEDAVQGIENWWQKQTHP